MRFVMLLTAVCALVLGTRDVSDLPGHDLLARWFDRPSSAQAAIELRCGALDGPARRDCVSRLEERIDEGRVDPESVVRVHCTRVDNVWTRTDPPEPPPVCTERFGGWIAG